MNTKTFWALIFLTNLIENLQFLNRIESIRRRLQDLKTGKCIVKNEDKIQDMIEEIEGAINKEKQLRREADDEINNSAFYDYFKTHS